MRFDCVVSSGCSGTAEDEKSEQADSGKILQAVDTDGYPICLFCNKRVQNGFKAGLSEARFCSYNCKEEYMVCFWITVSLMVS